MRTLQQRMTFGVLRALGLNERPYGVEGKISFVLDPSLTTLPNWADSESKMLQACRETIIRADRLYPWKDRNHFTGEEAKSIKFLSDGEAVTNNWAVPEVTLWYSIHPGIDRLGQKQLHAYEKYLSNIAELIASGKPPMIRTVRALVETRRSFEYNVQQ